MVTLPPLVLWTDSTRVSSPDHILRFFAAAFEMLNERSSKHLWLSAFVHIQDSVLTVACDFSPSHLPLPVKKDERLIKSWTKSNFTALCVSTLSIKWWAPTWPVPAPGLCLAIALAGIPGCWTSEGIKWQNHSGTSQENLSNKRYMSESWW